MVWIVRMIGKMTGEGKWKGEYRFYAHEEVMELLKGIAAALLQENGCGVSGTSDPSHYPERRAGGENPGRRVVFF